MKKRCEVALDDEGWRVSFYPGGGLPPIMQLFEREEEALLAVSKWCSTERRSGYGVELVLPQPDEYATS